MKRRLSAVASPLALAAAMAAPVVSLLGVSAVHAAMFTVNSFADGVDAVPGDGCCSTAAGVCTLRAAIQETIHPGVTALPVTELPVRVSAAPGSTRIR
jgi:CSLREA domain-containing protein